MKATIYEVKRAKSDEEILGCFPLLKILRPHLDEGSFVEQVREQEAAGYRLIFIADDSGVRSVAGFRLGRFLAWGKVLYVDDLITDPEARGTGFGTHLLKFLMGEAKGAGCDGIHLDTTIRDEEAHRLYLNLGMKIDSLHLSMKL